MKKIIIFLAIIFMTGCQSNYQVNCYLDEINGDSTEKSTLIGTFKENKLVLIENNGEITYNDLNSADYAYKYMKESFDSIDSEGFLADLTIQDKKMSYNITYDMKKMSKEDIKYILGDYGESKSFYKNYASSKGYSCK